ncbi:uncharacterized protein LOC131956442 [Physella acuta]|uniref:uncharacterized protein LOC131956442 n=1 Tax=Physella acuta TaxID=109671 RepID=UPI0027DAE931|nr:uncharacterized protein LOC131956442 [Physella acuta]
MDVLYNPDFDFDTYLTTTKALHISFIILIVLSNGALIFRIWLQKHFFYSAKYLLLVSLSIGDIFLALYSLVISTRIWFQDFSKGELTCTLWITAGVYQTHLINFVHGTGLVVLSAEYIHRCKSNSQRTKTPTDILRGLAISCVPWILGLVIILPLSLAGKDLETCDDQFTISRQQAEGIVSTILPAVIALVTAICVLCIKKDHVSHQQIELTPQQNQVFSNQVSQWNTQGAPVINGYNKHPEMTPQNTHLTSTAPQYNYPPQTAQYTNYPLQYPPPSFMSPPAYNTSFTPAMNNTQVNNAVIRLNPNPHITTPPLVLNNEKNKILSLALLFFFLVVPQAIFYLAFNLNINRNHNLALPKVAYYAIHDGLMWLMLLRPILTPLMAIAPLYLQHG